MKFDSRAITVAIAILVVGCGGGGGGGSTSTTPSTPSNPSSNTPATTPPVTTPVVVDTVTFAGTRADFSITRTGSGYTVTDKRSSVGTNISSAITKLQFSDVTINMTVGTKAAVMGTADINSLIDLYIATVNRVPDADTLVSLINRHGAGTTMAQMADEFYAEAVRNPASTDYSTFTKTSDFVVKVYLHAFGRTTPVAPIAPTPVEQAAYDAEVAAWNAEIAAWSARIDTNGISRGALIREMVTSARSGGGSLGSDINVISLLNNKRAVGRFFAIEQGVNYNDPVFSLSQRASIITAVTTTDINAAKALIGFTDASFDLTSG